MQGLRAPLGPPKGKKGAPSSRVRAGGRVEWAPFPTTHLGPELPLLDLNLDPAARMAEGDYGILSSYAGCSLQLAYTSTLGFNQGSNLQESGLTGARRVMGLGRGRSEKLDRVRRCRIQLDIINDQDYPVMTSTVTVSRITQGTPHKAWRSSQIPILLTQGQSEITRSPSGTGRRWRGTFRASSQGTPANHRSEIPRLC